MRSIGWLPLLNVTALVLAACGDGSLSETPTASPEPTLASSHSVDTLSGLPHEFYPPCETVEDGTGFPLQKGEANLATEFRAFCTGTLVDGRQEKLLFLSLDEGASWRLISRTAWEVDRLPRGIGEVPSEGAVAALSLIADRGWLGLRGSRVNVWQTHDGGVSWQPLDFPKPGIGVEMIGYRDELHIIVTFEDEEVWQSSDGGESWERVDRTGSIQDPPCGRILRELGARFRLDEAHEWLICQSSGRYTCNQDDHDWLFSADGGATWRILKEFRYSAAASHIVFTSPLDGWIGTGGSCSIVLRTRDGGVTWEYIQEIRLQTRGVAVLEFTDRLHGRIVTGGGQVSTYVTSDGGDTWSELAP